MVWLFLPTLVALVAATPSQVSQTCGCLPELRTYDQTNTDLKIMVSEAFLKIHELQAKIDALTATTTTKAPKITNPCSDGWVWNGQAKKCYSFNTNEVSWSSASKYCQRQGAILVKIESRDEQQFVASQLSNDYALRQYDFWIGLTYLPKERTFRWADDDKLGKFRAWEDSKRRIRRGGSSKKDEKNCVEMDNGDFWAWGREECSDREAFICQRKV